MGGLGGRHTLSIECGCQGNHVVQWVGSAPIIRRWTPGDSDTEWSNGGKGKVLWSTRRDCIAGGGGGGGGGEWGTTIVLCTMQNKELTSLWYKDIYCHTDSCVHHTHLLQQVHSTLLPSQLC